MKDFRTKPARVSIHRRPVRTQASKSFRARSVTARAPRARASHPPTGRANTLEKLITRLLQFLFGLTIAALITVGLSLYLLPKFFTLSQDSTMLWVPPREAVATQPSTLIHLSPSRHQLVIATIAPTVTLEQPTALQSQSLAQAYYSLQEAGVEAKMIQSTLGLAVSHSLDTVQVVALNQPVTTQPELSRYLWNEIKTQTGPFTITQRLQWYFFANSLAKSQTHSVTVNQASDWNKVYQAITLASDLKTCSLAVLNASGVNGVATRTARILENNDLTVISITDTPQIGERTTLIYSGSNPACQGVETLIRHLVPLNLATETNANLATEYRADMVVKIGTDLAQVLSTPLPQ